MTNPLMLDEGWETWPSQFRIDFFWLDPIKKNIYQDPILGSGPVLKYVDPDLFVRRKWSGFKIPLKSAFYRKF